MRTEAGRHAERDSGVAVVYLGSEAAEPGQVAAIAASLVRDDEPLDLLLLLRLSEDGGRVGPDVFAADLAVSELEYV
jgi:hypothetical protein